MPFCSISCRENWAVSSTDKRPRAIQSIIWPKFLLVWRSETRKEIIERIHYFAPFVFISNLHVCFAAKRTALFRSSAILNAPTLAKWDRNDFPPKTGCFLSQYNKICGFYNSLFCYFFFSPRSRSISHSKGSDFWFKTIFPLKNCSKNYT